MGIFFSCQVSEQMKNQASASTSIVIVLTDGELAVFLHSMSVVEVNPT